MGSIFTLMIVFTLRHGVHIGYKTMKRRPYWGTKKLLWRLISFLMEKLFLFQEIYLAPNQVIDQTIYEIRSTIIILSVWIY